MRAAHLREAGAPHYQRRRPEQTPLYRLVRAQLDGVYHTSEAEG